MLNSKKIYVVCVGVLLLLVGSCSWVNRKLGQEDDHFVEEVSESLIEDYFDLEPGSVDLTPNSPER